MIDAAALAEFQEKRKLWSAWLRDDKYHAIRKQIAEMVWNDAVFRVLNDARKPADGSPVSATNGLLGNFLNQGYVSSQILAVRRLVDRRNRNDVISLPRLLTDMERFRSKLTRELYVCDDGRDYEAAEQQHSKFDQISGVASHRRSRNDVISEGTLKFLSNKLQDESIKNIVALSHKFLAHAADENSRLTITGPVYPLFNTVMKAHRSIVEVFYDVESIIFNSVYFGMAPLLPLGALKGLELPYASEATIKKLREVWATYSKERERWGDGG